jgi:general secretion pathway protein A
MLAERFSLSEEAKHSKTSFLLELEELLKGRRDRDEATVLVIDEAQSLPPDLLEEIRLLSNIETNDDKLVSVIIAGQPELVALLNNESLRQLKQRIALRCELRPLSLQETAVYIAGRIRAAGGVDARVFTREAVELIYERSRGIPRTISVIADNALLGGFAAGQRPVNSQLVRDVCRDFDLRGPAGLTGSPANGNGHGADNAERLLSVAPRPAAEPAKRPASNELFGGYAAKRKRFSFFGN